jgi:hypothetical protein
VLNDDQVEQLAEMEHGRFNLERLTDGWQIGDREVVRLATPHLRPWDELDDDVKEYDREAVRNIPAALASAGWGVEPREASASTNGGAARDRVAV